MNTLAALVLLDSVSGFSIVIDLVGHSVLVETIVAVPDAGRLCPYLVRFTTNRAAVNATTVVQVPRLAESAPWPWPPEIPRRHVTVERVAGATDTITMLPDGNVGFGPSDPVDVPATSTDIADGFQERCAAWSAQMRACGGSSDSSLESDEGTTAAQRELEVMAWAQVQLREMRHGRGPVPCTVGELRAWRNERGLTQAHAAEVLHVRCATIERAETESDDSPLKRPLLKAFERDSRSVSTFDDNLRLLLGHFRRVNAVASRR